MNLRIRDNSIRVRLSQTEVESVRSQGHVKAWVSFPGGTGPDHIIESKPGTVKPSAHFSDGALKVNLPESAVQEWTSTEQVSIGADEILDDGDHLTILVEKNFACLAPREGEDESDMFPQPLEGQEQD